MRRLAFVAWVVVACAHAPPPPAAPAEPDLRARDFYPLRVGNRWTYELTPDPEQRPRTIEIVGQEGAFFVDNMNGHLRQDDTGLRDGSRYLLENPVEPGHKWVAVQSVRVAEHFEITEAGHPCAVKAGTFGICTVVRMTEDEGHGHTLVLESTYAQGIGLVAVRTTLEQPGSAPAPQMQMELVSYHLGP